ncbi:hypothetical protein H9L12_00325 [Sphingomonas rhizophila]|uniref:PRC-barrel domain-containing protein n=1 Tax=Sphingomonas rhizophila TaxID=2071607 RepID=A0A7G9SBC1_9SPHN|nr:hypothetical protein [Sphingomonas rhizophila]QNN65146.1 hypothetical protein H9L12_00325 [Sphingomonas rhizophila]
MKSKILGLILAIGVSGPALAQATGAAVPGGGDASRITNNNRLENSNYNRVVSKIDPVKPADEKPVAVRNARPAQPAEVVAGSALRDVNGVPVGKVESVESDGAIILSGEKRVKVPLTAFGKDDSGLLIAVTQTKLNELIAKVSSAK